MDLTQQVLKVQFSQSLIYTYFKLFNYSKVELRDVNQPAHVHWEVSEVSEQPNYQGEAAKLCECVVLE
jgi:hypothetical protein